MVNSLVKQSFYLQGAHVLGLSDFTKPETQERIRQLLDGRSVDCVMSDMAPNASGVRCLDQEKIMSLCYSVLRFAISISSPGACLLVKVWDNAEIRKFEKDALHYYKTLKHIKPKASRSDSSEKFLLAKEFIGVKS